MPFLFIAIIVFMPFSCAVSDPRITKIDQVLTQLHHEKKFHGQILIAEQGQILYRKSFGYANIEHKRPFSETSMTDIASVSKTFMSLAIMMLIDNGQLKIDDDISQFLPSFPYQSITINHLLTHTSGLYGEQREKIRNQIKGQRMNNHELYNTFIRIKPALNFQPGKDYHYSNTNYTLLALIVEKVSGISYPDFLHTRIFDRLHMKHSFLMKKNVPQHLQKDIMSYYRRPQWLSSSFQNIQSLPENIAEEKTFGNKYGASKIYTTADDLFKFHQALQSYQLINKETTALMYKTFNLPSNYPYDTGLASNYTALSANGWRVAKDESAGRIVFHAGGFRGGRSFFIRNIDKDQVIIMLTNNTETDRYTFTFPMRVLNNQNYKLDKISLPRNFAQQYINHGIDSALNYYQQHQNDSNYQHFIDWDYEEIGREMIEKGDKKSAIALFKLYTQHMPDDGFAWELLAQTQWLTGDKISALKNYRKAQKLLPNNTSIKKAIKHIDSINNKQ